MFKSIQGNNNLKAFLLYLNSSCINILLSIFIVKLSLKHLLSLQEAIFLKVSIPILFLLIFKRYNIKKNLLLVNKGSLLKLILLATLSLIDVFSWINAISLVPINNAIIVSFLVPILTMIATSIINKETIPLKKKVSMIFSFCAATLCINSMIPSFNIGYVYLMVDICAAVLITILLKKLNLFSSYFILLTRLSLILPVSLVFNKFFINSNLPNLFTNWNHLLYFAIPICYLIERLSFIKMYKYANISFIEPFKYLNIVFSSIFGYLLLNQKLEITQIVCFVVIVGSNILNNINLGLLVKKISTKVKN